MPILLAFAAALCFAAAYVLQYHEAHVAPRRLFLSPRLLVELARHRIWVAGIGAMLVGNGLQAAALGTGSLAVVEPILTASLLFALPLSAAWRRERLLGGEWAGALMVSAGLGVVLGVGSPTAGRVDMNSYEWMLVGLTTWGLGAGLVAAGLRLRPASYRAAFVGAGAGVLFGLQDALTGYCLHWMGKDFWHLVLSWQPYVLLATAVYGLTLAQSAYEIGPLSASLPAMSVGEPVIGMLIGIVALGERLDTAPVALALEAAGAVVMVAGVWLLARSPLVCGTGRARLHHAEVEPPVDTPRREPAARH